MTILLVQIFVLLLAAFLAGAAAACAYRRRAFSTASRIEAPSPQERSGGGGPAQEPSSTIRFERALGGPEAVVPPPFQGASRPMIEVQPAPEPPLPKVPVPPQRLAVPTTPSSPLPAAPARRSSRFAAFAEVSPTGSQQAAAPPPPTTPRLTEPAAGPAALKEESRPAAARGAAVAAGAETAAPPAEKGSSASEGADDLTRIRAISPEMQQRLNDLGIRKFRDIAEWAEGDIDRVGRALGLLTRIADENWVDQARILARGTGALPERPLRAAEAVARAGADRLNRIIGVDPETERLLLAHGATRFAQIAAWTSRDIEAIENLLGRPGRVGLENWIGQARILARGSGGEPPTAAHELSQPTPGPAPQTLAESAAAVAMPRAGGPHSEVGGLRSVRSAALRRDQIGTIAPPIGAYDDLKRIRGIGVLIEKKLNSLGVTTYEQIANWTGADIDRISQILDFKGRVERESWVEQARILGSGGQTDFSRRAERGDVEATRNSRA
jgi:predicted flap endonuclease-1-like 5' DNA nuclease